MFQVSSIVKKDFWRDPCYSFAPQPLQNFRPSVMAAPHWGQNLRAGSAGGGFQFFEYGCIGNKGTDKVKDRG